MTENERKRKKYAELSIEERRVKIQKSSHANKIAQERRRIQNKVSNKENIVLQEGLCETTTNGMLSNSKVTNLFIIVHFKFKIHEFKKCFIFYNKSNVK